MIVTLERAVLLKALQHVQSVVEKRTTMPILGNVKVSAEKDCLSLNATDTDLDITETGPAEVETAGVTTAPAHMLYEIARKLPDGAQVTLTLDGERQQLQVKAGRSRFTLACLSAEDFPVMSGSDWAATFTLTGSDLRALIDGTRFAISTEETRYYLNGIYFHVVETDEVTALRAVATDGHRLARVDVPRPEGATGMPGVIIPRKTVNELRKLVDDSDEDVTVSLSETRIHFACGRLTLTSKLIDGAFPEYQRVIPAHNDKCLLVDRADVHKGVDRVSTIATDKSRAVKFTVQNNALTLSANSPDQGSAVEELEAEYDSPPLEIGFNARYLLDILEQIDGDRVRFDLGDSSAPTVIQEEGRTGALFVLMPMRV